MNTVSLDEVRAAQRAAPDSEETKELQRRYERSLSGVRAAARAAKRRADEDGRKAEEALLRADLLAPRRLIPCVYLCVVSCKWAQWAGNAPAVAGGWVAVDLPGVRHKEHDFLPPTNRVAALPESWEDESHRDIGIGEVQQIWAEECLDNDGLKQAIALLNGISTREGGE